MWIADLVSILRLIMLFFLQLLDPQVTHKWPHKLGAASCGHNIIVLQSDYDTTPRWLLYYPADSTIVFRRFYPGIHYIRYEIPLYSHRYEWVCMHVCIFIRLIYLQVTRNMVLFLLFTHINPSTLVGISLIGYASVSVYVYTVLNLVWFTHVLDTPWVHEHVLMYNINRASTDSSIGNPSPIQNFSHHTPH